MPEYGKFPFGLREVKIVSANGTTVATLIAARTLGFQERIVQGELRGNDRIVSLVAFPDGIEWSLEEGGIPMEAWAIMTGRTLTTSGTTPNQKTTLAINANDVYPYFKVYAKSVGEASTDDIHVKLARCKLQSPLEGEFSDGEFFVTKCSGLAIADGAGLIGEIVVNETAAALPSS